MISVNVLYPNTSGARFDMEYYLSKHIPMVKKLLGAALKGVTVEQGLGGAAPGERAEYSTLCRLLFDSVESFQSAFGPHAGAVQADIRNYSSVAPVIQINELKLA